MLCWVSEYKWQDSACSKPGGYLKRFVTIVEGYFNENNKFTFVDSEGTRWNYAFPIDYLFTSFKW